MPSLRSALVLALLLLGAAPAASHAQSSYGGGVERVSRLDSQLENALRYYGYEPYRLTRDQSYALDRARTELLGAGTGRRALSRTQATAIVYMALVFPREQGRYDRQGRGYGDYEGRGGYDRPNGGYGREPRRGRCVEVEAQAYELGNVVSGSARDGGLFVNDPEKGQARSLARRIQQGAVQCGRSDAADVAGEIIEELSRPLPERSGIARQVAELKSALRGERYDGDWR
ncbi:MAG TPA: hypothetical protein VF665_10020 [Longimicrobium sp.]|uniref:hypothetical protein n=1 Tax=Longimicrobium sp. TaxID=2029185 RepID=UPI002EDA7DF2